MKKITLVLIAILQISLVFAQKVSLTTNGYKVELKKIDTLFYEEVDKNITSNYQSDISKQLRGDNYIGLIKKSFEKDKSSRFTSPFYVYEDGTLQAPTSTLFFKPIDIISFREKFSSLGKIVEHSTFKGYYYLHTNKDRVKSDIDIFEICNSMFENKEVVIIEPVYSKLLKQHNPLLPFQWNIQNTGIVGGSIIGADMRVRDAWCLSTGSNIRVAVIDDGVDLTHPDLQANLLPGFDATGNGSGGAPIPQNSHGTSCAGIIAAINNTIGNIGVAYNSRIIPIRMGIVNPITFVFATNDNMISNSINEAVNRGADVISNSWGGGGVAVQINLALDNAVNNGRGGLGCIVLFSTGNRNGNVLYPATRPNVIAVGASTPCDTRKRSSNDPTLVGAFVNIDGENVSCDGETLWGSNFGDNLDIVAPGVLIPTTIVQGTGTLFLPNHRADFNGTSAACPNAAGVVALMLSVNPTLTGLQARQILENNCDKILGNPNPYNYTVNANQPNGTWNNQVGYGRANALNSVLGALGTYSINGTDLFCNSTNYSFSSSTGIINTQWQSSNPSVISINPNTGVAVGLNNGQSIISLVANNSNFCTTPFVLAQKTVTRGNPNTIPILITPSGTSLCTGTPFTAETYLDGATTYNWTPPSGLNFTSPNGTFQINGQVVSTPLGGQLTVTATNSCGTVFGSSAVIPQPEFPFPGKNQPYINLTTALCLSNVFQAQVVAVPSATQYWWRVREFDVNGNQTNTPVWVSTTSNVSPSHSIQPATRSARVFVYAVTPCGNTVTINELFNKCKFARMANPAISENNITAIPNPTKDRVRIETKELKEANGSFEVINSNNTIVKKGRFSIVKNYLEIDLTGLPSGIYTIVIRTSKETRQAKIIKE